MYKVMTTSGVVLTRTNLTYAQAKAALAGLMMQYNTWQVSIIKVR